MAQIIKKCFYCLKRNHQNTASHFFLAFHSLESTTKYMIPLILTTALPEIKKKKKRPEVRQGQWEKKEVTER